MRYTLNAKVFEGLDYLEHFEYGQVIQDRNGKTYEHLYVVAFDSETGETYCYTKDNNNRFVMSDDGNLLVTIHTLPAPLTVVDNVDTPTIVM